MAENELSKLKYKRTGLKTRFTNLKKLIDKVQDENPVTDSSLLQLEHRINQLQPTFDQFEEIQLEIECLENSVGTEERENFEETYFSTIANAQHILKQSASKRTQVPVQQSNRSLAPELEQSEHSENSQSTHNSQNSQNKTNIKLPTISLPKFSGSYDLWLEFRDTYKSLIHTNDVIGDIQKFHYLRASLEGDAAQLIKNIDISAANYEIAWNSVCDRYDNERLMIHNHIKALFDLPLLAKESFSGLRTLLDSVSKHLRSLETLNQPVEHWDTLLIYMIENKLDRTTARRWEEEKPGTQLPTLEGIKDFIKRRADLLETLHARQTEPANEKNKFIKTKDRERRANAFVSASEISCIFCKGSHAMYNCQEFLKLDSKSRSEHAKALKCCLNCLRLGHFLRDCKSRVCKHCGRKHNTLLHIPNEDQSNQQATSRQETETNVLTQVDNSYILLPTAVVKVTDSQGKQHKLRALLDSGSQSNFISQEACDRLKLKKAKIQNFTVIGINQARTSISEMAVISLGSCHTNFRCKLNCLIVPRISGTLPSSHFSINHFAIPSHVNLADPNFNVPDKIDLLIGSTIFWTLILKGSIQMNKHLPSLHNTKLGWVIGGSVGSMHNQSYCNFSRTVEIQEQLAKFWNIEELPQHGQILSKEERSCEEHFSQTVKRAEDGRFIVSVPLKEPVEKLGESKSAALKRFYMLERKLQANPKLKTMYVEFIKEYQSLNHMTKVDNEETKRDDGKISYYLPHHGVIREDSLTTKLRVVFDGSAVTESGISLNQIQMVGPVIQDSLFSILLRFRQHTYAVSSDITKMYRQVLIDTPFRALHQILWRSHPDQDVETFQLNTVTYGTASAPFLAIRCLKQLSDENIDTHPEAAAVIQHDFYVDDMLSGANTVEATIELSKQVSSILKSGGFELRKWASNSTEVLDGLQSSEPSSSICHLGQEENCKTLGLLWCCSSDAFMFKIKEADSVTRKSTKRLILSDTASIFDPMGLISPAIMNGKLLMQKLWMLKLNWDEPVSSHIHEEWIRLRGSLIKLKELQIPRHVVCDAPVSIQLHGFSDASEHAYGACIFLRSISSTGKVSVHLLCSKGRVAPLKRLTVPRLELCGALMLAQLYDTVMKSLNMDINSVHLWTDSTIVLGWIHISPHLLKTFVGTRVAEVQNLTSEECWHHVRSNDNPADIISRGADPTDLIKSDLWWHGPEWLQNLHEDSWPASTAIIQQSELPETCNQTFLSTATDCDKFLDIARFSSLNKAIRVFAYCMRFIKNCRSSTNSRVYSSLTTIELHDALNTLVKFSQQECFQVEYHDIKNGKISSKNKLTSLNPFIDATDLIRVGGRLHQSQLPYDQKHPIVLSNKHRLTLLLFRQEHVRLLHAGPQMLFSSIRNKFWPIGGRNLAKKVVRECVRCRKANPQSIVPLMGNLPEKRIRPMPPFSVTGVDYAGPFILRDRKGRGFKTYKAYVSLFVCFSTKAIHLELVTELTAQGFLSTLRRFISRRGKPIHIYSDNGTNFVKANTDIKELYLFLQSNETILSSSLSEESVTWHFIPAHAPTFGGLWEAGVKSTKYHLKRVLSSAMLTFEEFYTVLTQVEGVLNSRPLTPLSSDPADLEVLTPAHFLIGRSLAELPDPNLLDIKVGRLSRFQYLQQLKQHFWKRWSSEYLSELQQRTKWRTNTAALREGAMVLIKEDFLPPSKWPLGRITALHPGKDNVVRVVSIKTVKGVVKRAVSKVCPLPIETTDSKLSVN